MERKVTEKFSLENDDDHFLNVVSGVIRVPTHFWCPTRIIVPSGETIEYKLPDTIKSTNYTNSAGLRYEAIACREKILQGETEHPYMTYENSVQLARIIESARNQIIASNKN